MPTKRPIQPNISKWYHELLLPACAAVYLLVCIFDFIIFPVYTAYTNQSIQAAVIAKLDSKDIGTFADDLTKSLSANHQWNPITLMGGGLFHLAFGALLSAGITTRGLSKKSEVEGYFNTINSAPTESPNQLPK